MRPDSMRILTLAPLFGGDCGRTVDRRRLCVKHHRTRRDIGAEINLRDLEMAYEIQLGLLLATNLNLAVFLRRPA
jgi:hypothetical protein